MNIWIKKNLFSDFKNFSGSTYICTYIHTHMIVLSVIKTQISFPFYWHVDQTIIKNVL